MRAMLSQLWDTRLAGVGATELRVAGGSVMSSQAHDPNREQTVTAPREGDV